MAREKAASFGLLAYLVLASSSSLAQGAQDYSLDPLQFRTSSDHCTAKISALYGNTIYEDSDSNPGGSSFLRLVTKDRKNGKSRITPAAALGLNTIAISDSGPAGSVNAAYALPNSGQFYRERIFFSTNSGESFSEKLLTWDPPYEQFPGVLGGGATRDNYMLFGADGNLYVFYFGKDSTQGTIYASLLVQIIDPSGTVIGFENLSEQAYGLAYPPTPASNIPGPGTGVSTLANATSFIEAVVVGNRIVLLVRPGSNWWDQEANGGIGLDTTAKVEAIVYDYSLPLGSRVVQRIHMGSRNVASTYNSPYQSSNLQGDIITTDGHSVFMLNQGDFMDVDPGPAVYNIPNYQFRRFPPCEEQPAYFPGNCPPGGFFPDNDTFSTSAPFLDLPAFPVQVQTANFFTPGSNQFSVQGYVTGFAAPRYLSGFTNLVDVLYITPAQQDANWHDDYIQRLRFNPDVPLSAGNVPEILNDLNPQTALDSGMVPNTLSIPQTAFLMSFVSVSGGTAATFCQEGSRVNNGGSFKFNVTDIS